MSGKHVYFKIFVSRFEIFDNDMYVVHIYLITTSALKLCFNAYQNKLRSLIDTKLTDFILQLTQYTLKFANVFPKGTSALKFD